MEYYYLPFVFVATIAAPILFPSIFWKNNDEKVRIIFYNVNKKSENPYFEEQTAISLYDPDNQLYFEVDDVYDNESYEEICVLLKDLSKSYDTIYLVTYDIENKEQSVKLILEDLFDDISTKIRFLDIKMLFYSTHPMVQKIVYNDVMDFYHVPKLDVRVIEYCALFDSLN